MTKLPYLWVTRGRFAGHAGRFIRRHPSGLVQVNLKSHRPEWIPERWLSFDQADVKPADIQRATDERKRWKEQNRKPRPRRAQYTHNTFLPGGLPGKGKSR